jgi:hypothetical protein
MPPSGMLRRVALERTNVSEERIAYIMRLRRIGELGTTLAVNSNRSTQRSVVLTRATRRHIPEDDILHSHCRGNLQSYKALPGWTL